MTVTVWFVVKLPAVALNVAVAAPEPTVTDAGTVNAVLVSVTVTAAPPLGAALFSVTVQVLDAFGPILLGLHASDDTRSGDNRLIDAVFELLL